MSPIPTLELITEHQSYEPKNNKSPILNEPFGNNESQGIFPAGALDEKSLDAMPDLDTVTTTTASSYLQSQVSTADTQVDLQRLYNLRLQQLHAQNVARNMMNAIPGRKQYSQADLDAAVQDIRSGRIGTRRASVVYGIPRSTLRNKIYKLDGLSGRRSVEESSCTAMPIQYTAQTTSSTNPTSSAILSMTSQPLRSPAEISQLYYNQLVRLQTTAPLLSEQTSSQAAIVQGLLLRQIYASNKAFTRNGSVPNMNVTCSQRSSPMERETKPTRPKRGQYRRYEKSALDRAVQAVRAGEMSVHRAGSFFGVPHSTLEYKVKERARKPVQQQSNSFDSDNSETLGSPCNIFPTSPFLMPNVTMMDANRLQALNDHFKRVLSAMALNNMGVIGQIQ
ncbi:unnamed protein product [Bursaphelenchus xylophilus]|uniref:(pine wood nematode) hypothetical protein n=1 Tax=Bursaphelenchus xylophilus TaxID=6326 RepID=A0A1I7SQF5_BURXY|nr:unnamed protein product [Bursaphelenchus xylophilus]CAG9109823.1 unnamed protein product [Bursaphelenchus xylophilus]